MLSLRECFDKHDCDRGSRHGYERVYEPLFEPIRNQPLRILEIGVLRGAGIESWLEYFPNAQVLGIDTFGRVPLHQVSVRTHPRAKLIICDSTLGLPKEWRNPGHYDVIIDDGDHRAKSQLRTFENFRYSVVIGGMYFIEDVFPAKRDVTKLFAALPDAIHHDLRTEKIPDSYILEIKKC